jgi:hypothetical protein
MTKTKRIQSGLYEVTINGRVFQIEELGQHSYGECASGWMLYEMKGDVREFWNDFATKRAAVAAIVDSVN